MNRDKQIDEMRHLADEMGKAISTEYEKRVLADERKLEAVLKANGWCKASDVAREIFEEIERNLVTIDDVDFNRFRCIGARTFAELKKKYTEGEG